MGNHVWICLIDNSSTQMGNFQYIKFPEGNQAIDPIQSWIINSQSTSNSPQSHWNFSYYQLQPCFLTPHGSTQRIPQRIAQRIPRLPSRRCFVVVFVGERGRSDCAVERLHRGLGTDSRCRWAAVGSWCRCLKKMALKKKGAGVFMVDVMFIQLEMKYVVNV